MHIFWIAAENSLLKGAKVGGVADVTAHLCRALQQLKCRITILIPSYGFLHRHAGAVHLWRYPVRFRGIQHETDIFAIQNGNAHTDLNQLVVHHPILVSRRPDSRRFQIYTHDPPRQPYFTDATRFAFFSQAAAAAVSQQLIQGLDCIHLHDWHAAFVAILRRFHPDHECLQAIRTVYSIHNLAFQGVRPFGGSASSTAAWFPEMRLDHAAVADPRWPDTLNPMAAAIRLCDAVHTVSPSYASEIQNPSRPPHFFGGEGLEADLRAAAAQGRLTGILNGSPETAAPGLASCERTELLHLFRSRLIRWSAQHSSPSSADFVGYARALEMQVQANRAGMLLTGVSRAGEQKMLILRAAGGKGPSGLERVLRHLNDKGLFVLLAQGDPQYERFLTEMSARFANFLFLNGYSEACAAALYTCGDLFLMPSSFEPCGLGQMLAMRRGQPCLVHAVGGLKDTVRQGYNGFAFQGDTLAEQVDAFVRTAVEAIRLKTEDPTSWQQISRRAAETAFRWHETATQYIERLYR